MYIVLEMIWEQEELEENFEKLLWRLFGWFTLSYLFLNAQSW